MIEDVTPTAIARRFVEAYRLLLEAGVVRNKKEFCRALDMPPQNFHPIEKGERCASLPNLCALVRRYGISPSWLFTGEGKMVL